MVYVKGEHLGKRGRLGNKYSLWPAWWTRTTNRLAPLYWRVELGTFFKKMTATSGWNKGKTFPQIDREGSTGWVGRIH